MNYKIGDIVIICHVPGQTDILPWEPRMDSCCGLEGTVVSIDYINSDKIYAVKSIDRLGKENTFWYQGNWLMREDNSYWGKFTSYEAYRKAGLKTSSSLCLTPLPTSRTLQQDLCSSGCLLFRVPRSTANTLTSAATLPR